jgi:hypothetical protein
LPVDVNTRAAGGFGRPTTAQLVDDPHEIDEMPAVALFKRSEMLLKT